MESQRRYDTDLVFRQVVDALESLVERAELAPSEIREAAMLACIRHEMRRGPGVLRTGFRLVPAADVPPGEVRSGREALAAFTDPSLGEPWP